MQSQGKQKSALPVTRYHGQLSLCTITEKTNDPILRKRSGARTDRRTDGQTDESDLVGRCPTNVECPITHYNQYNNLQKY